MDLSKLPPEWRARIERHRSRMNHRWVRIVGWMSLGLFALLVLVVVGVALAFNTGRFHAYLLRTVEEKTKESLGTNVHLQNFAIHPASLSVDLYGLSVEGAPPRPFPQLLQVSHASASVRIVSVLSRTWYLDEVRVDDPVVQIYVDAHGNSNIPTIKSSSNSSSNTSIFDLGVRHAVLNNGAVFYNNQPQTVAVDLRNLEFKSSFAPALKQYSGTLSYSDGQLAYGSFKPTAHDLKLGFNADPNTFNLTGATLRVGASQLKANATLRNYNDPEAEGQYELTADGGELQSLMKNPAIPSGIVQASGSVHYHCPANSNIIACLNATGDLKSDKLAVKTPTLRSDVSNLLAHYTLADGNLTLSDLKADAFGGHVAAAGAMKDIGGNTHSEFTASVRNVSIANVSTALGNATKGLHATLGGRLNADAKASWGKTLDDLVAQANATIHGNASSKGTPAIASANNVPEPASIPIESVLHAIYTASNSQLTMRDSFLRTPHTNITMNGMVSSRSNLGVHLQANDLAEIGQIAELFSAPKDGMAAQPLAISGSTNFNGTVSGAIAAPQLKGHLEAANLAIQGSNWKTVRGDVDLNPSMARLQHAEIVPASRGRITLDASVGLKKWSFTNTSLIEANATLSQLNLADLAKLANQTTPVTGTLNGSVAVHGTEVNPIGNGNLTLANVSTYDESIPSAKVTFSGDGHEVQTKLTIQLDAGNIEGNATIRPQERTYMAQINTQGIHLGDLGAVKARSMKIAGDLALNARGQGSFDNPQLEATLQIPALDVQGQKVANVNLKMNLANHLADAQLTSSALNTSIQAKAKIRLTGDFPADASIDTQGIPLQPILAVYAPSQADSVTGQTELHATLHGPLKNKQQLEAHVTIPVLKVAYGSNIQLAATAPIRADYRDGVVTVQPSSINGTNTDLHFQGSIPVNGTGPMALQLQGAVNLQIVQLFEPDIRTSGQIRFNIDSHGPAEANDIGGEIDVVDANYSSPDLPVGLQHANGVLKVTRNRVNISSFQGTVGGGTVTAQGGIGYRPSLQFEMGVEAKNIRILYPQGMRENVSANLRLTGNPEDALLNGQVNLSDLSFTQGFDLNDFIGQFSSASAPPSQGMAQNVRLNIAVQSSNNVNLVSRTLSIGGAANLQVRGTAADPVILGRVNLNNGDIILNGTRFVLNGGTIQFINPTETEPVVNLSLNTNIQQYSIDLRFQGPVNQLRTEYNSDPALPQADIIHLLAFGNTTEASAQAAGTTSTTQTAESLVASQVSSQVTSRVSKIAGISQLSISPVLAGSSSQGPPGAVITIQQRVTGNLFVNFSTNVASTQSQTIQGQYKVSPRVSVSATRDPNGGFGFDTLIKKSW